MSGLGATGRDPAAIDVALISHLHGDHVGGLPFLYMAYQFPARRSSPLIVAGPPGIEEKLLVHCLTDTLARADALGLEVAEDGMLVTL